MEAKLGKIINGVIAYAPSVYRDGDEVIYNFDKNLYLMQSMGYKPVIEENDIKEYKTIKKIEEKNNRIYIYYIIDNSEDTIKKIQNEMIIKTKSNLFKYLDSHPLVSKVKDNTEMEYSVSLDKQNQLTSIISDYMSKALPYIISESIQDMQSLMSFMDELPIPLFWNSRGETSREWKYSELYQLKNEITDYVKPIIEYQRKLEKEIINCKTQQELKNINIDFTEDIINHI